MTKTCTVCHQNKPIDQFWRDNRRLNGRMSRCKSCKTRIFNKYRKQRGYDKTRYWKNPLKERERHLVKKYGVTLRDYDALFERQSGACAICGKQQVRALDVDHNHVTGIVRGLLCTSCNRMIGHSGDDPTRLLAAAKYLGVPPLAAVFIQAAVEALNAANPFPLETATVNP